MASGCGSTSRFLTLPALLPRARTYTRRFCKFTRPADMKPQLILMAGLLLATLGMASIVLGVIVPGLFFPSVYLLDGAAVILIFGTFMHLLTPAADAQV